MFAVRSPSWNNEAWSSASSDFTQLVVLEMVFCVFKVKAEPDIDFFFKTWMFLYKLAANAENRKRFQIYVP